VVQRNTERSTVCLLHHCILQSAQTFMPYTRNPGKPDSAAAFGDDDFMPGLYKGQRMESGAVPFAALLLFEFCPQYLLFVRNGGLYTDFGCFMCIGFSMEE
jgi:hypothetical protein